MQRRIIMECCLAQGELVRIDGERDGVTLRCTSGTIWLTCGDGRDYLLSAGKSFKIDPGHSAVAEALQTVKCTMLKTSAHSAVKVGATWSVANFSAFFTPQKITTIA
jgi:quercetin dioxygenase-like cupin family protein